MGKLPAGLAAYQAARVKAGSAPQKKSLTAAPTLTAGKSTFKAPADTRSGAKSPTKATKSAKHTGRKLTNRGAAPPAPRPKSKRLNYKTLRSL